MTDSRPDSLSDARPAPSHEPVRHHHRRTDWYSARTVEEGIRVQQTAGTQAAAAFLRERSIVADITVRTLLHPDQRRNG